MIAPNRLNVRRQSYAPGLIVERVSDRVFGDTEWVPLAAKSCVEHLLPAIRSGKRHRIANAVRAIAHAPTPEQVNDVVGAACDSMLANAYVERDARAIANVAMAKDVAGEIMGHAENRSVSGKAELLRSKVDSYLKITGLVDRRLAERLDAVGSMAGRIAEAMHLSAGIVLDVQLAGRLHDIAIVSAQGTKVGHRNREGRLAQTETFVESEPELAHLAPIIHAQHERYDGRGFPDRLTGDEIPLGSRILTVAIAFVELVTPNDRSGEMTTPNDACRELILRAGADLDPDVVTATLHLLHYRQRITNRSA